MKILKPGSIERAKWSKEITCTGRGNGGHGCGAVLLVEEGDLYYTRCHVRDEVDVFVTFTCGFCGRKNDLERKPDIVREPIFASEEAWQKEQQRKAIAAGVAAAAAQA